MGKLVGTNQQYYTSTQDTVISTTAPSAPSAPSATTIEKNTHRERETESIMLTLKRGSAEERLTFDIPFGT